MRHRLNLSACLVVGALTIAVAGMVYAAHGLSGSVATSTPPQKTSTASASTSLPGLTPAVTSVDWTLEEFVRDGGDYPNTDGPPITITLHMRMEDSSVSGSSGCNTYSGTYVAEGVALRMQVASSTHATCAADITAFEQAYLQALGNVQAYGFDYGELLLGNGDGRTILDFHSRPTSTGAPALTAPALTASPRHALSPTATVAAPLLQRIADRTWSLTHFTQDGRDIPFAASARLTLWLRTQDGSMGGNACPFLTGTYVANGATLRLQPHRNHSIQVRCTPATALLQLEYLGALQIVETYRVENGSLTLASADGRLQLIFTEDPCVTTWLPQARGAPIGVFSGTPPPATPCPAG